MTKKADLTTADLDTGATGDDTTATASATTTTAEAGDAIKAPPAGLDALDAIQEENAAVLEGMKAGEGKPNAAEQAEAEKAAARLGAAMAMGFVESLIHGKAPYVQIPDEAREKVVDKTAILMAKHHAAMPAWLTPYKEELEWGVAVGGMAFSVWMQINAHKAELARQEWEAHQARQQGQGGGAPRVNLEG